jgi:hypothetical protein
MLITCIEKGDIMSEIAIFPIDDEQTSFKVSANKTIVGMGNIIAPFTMFNITDTPFLSDKKSQGWQIFASNQPLTTGVYWVMFIKTGGKLKNKYFQCGKMIDNNEFEIYFKTCRKPLLLQNLTRSYALPYQTPMQRLRVGKIDDVKLINSFDLKGIDYMTLDRPLSLDECEKLMIYRSVIQRGVNLDVLYSTD